MTIKSLFLVVLFVLLAVALLMAVTGGPKGAIRALYEPLENVFFRHFALAVMPSMKQVIVFAPTSTANGATTSGNIDCLGYDHLSVDIVAPTADVVSNKFATCKLSHSDTTDATNFSDLTKFVAGGTGGFTLANANTAAAYGVKLNVDLRAIKRYVKLSVSPRTTQVLAAVANLQKAEQSPLTAATAGVNTLVEG